jgi:hypothetical protein
MQRSGLRDERGAEKERSDTNHSLTNHQSLKEEFVIRIGYCIKITSERLRLITIQIKDSIRKDNRVR